MLCARSFVLGVVPALDLVRPAWTFGSARKFWFFLSRFCFYSHRPSLALISFNFSFLLRRLFPASACLCSEIFVFAAAGLDSLSSPAVLLFRLGFLPPSSPLFFLCRPSGLGPVRPHNVFLHHEFPYVCGLARTPGSPLRFSLMLTSRSPAGLLLFSADGFSS
jgi:hypothetical protein